MSRETSVDNDALLRRHGLQVTAQRLAVLRAVSDRPHSTADDIDKVVRAEIGAISRQAVYDALAALTDKGLLRRIQPAGSPARYEDRVGDNHHHLICRTCSRMVDVDCAVGDTPCLTAADDSGYEIDEAEVIYWGRCPECVDGARSHADPRAANQQIRRTERRRTDVSDSGSESENPAIPSPTPKPHRPRSNQDWWPNQLDLQVLHQHSPRANPMGEDFDYAEEFKTLDVDALKQDIFDGDDDVAGLVAGRLRPLRAALHPDDVARRRHVPHRRRPGRWRRAARSASPPSTAGPTTPTSTRRAGCSGRSSRSTAGRSPGPTCSSSPATAPWSRWGSRRSASASGERTSGSPTRSSGAPRTRGSATSATAATGSSPVRSAPCRWA